MSVFDLKMGESGKISRINLTGAAKARLTSLGIKEGQRVEVLSFSLFKSSVLISCAAVRVGVRKSLARKIEVEA
ncbi:MAG: ferrous iron transport protein A [Clostridia bacterium]|nr:ferrous iron transport protein A [Clostridia bacterium]